MKGPAVIISSSGMLSGGRILHHCRIRLPHPENTLLITGHQARGHAGPCPAGRGEGARIHKGEVPVLAEVADSRACPATPTPSEILRWLVRGRAAAAHGVPDPRRGGGGGRHGRAHHARARLPDPRARPGRDGGAWPMKAVIVDIDGVVLHDDTALPGARELVEWLVGSGLPFLFLTNYPSMTPADLQRRFLGAGLARAGPALLHLGHGHRGVPARPGRRPPPRLRGGRRRARGRPLRGRLQLTEEENADYVVLGETTSFNFDMIRRAAWLIQCGARFVATNPDVAGPQGRPSCGALAAPIERISGKRPFYVGKPSAFMMRAALRYLQAHSEDTWMVGRQHGHRHHRRHPVRPGDGARAVGGEPGRGAARLRLPAPPRGPGRPRGAGGAAAPARAGPGV